MSCNAAAAAAAALQSCPTLCDPIDGSPPGFPVPGILQARTLEWIGAANECVLFTTNRGHSSTTNATFQKITAFCPFACGSFAVTGAATKR